MTVRLRDTDSMSLESSYKTQRFAYKTHTSKTSHINLRVQVCCSACYSGGASSMPMHYYWHWRPDCFKFKFGFRSALLYDSGVARGGP